MNAQKFLLGSWLFLIILGCREAVWVGSSLHQRSAVVNTSKGKTIVYISSIVSTNGDVYRMPLAIAINASDEDNIIPGYATRDGSNCHDIYVFDQRIVAREGAVVLVDLKEPTYRVLDDVEWELDLLDASRESLQERKVQEFAKFIVDNYSLTK